MGKALLMVILGFSALMGTVTLNLSRRSLESVQTYSNQYAITAARNAATSGVYMSLSRLYRSNTWRTGFSNLNLNNAILNVDIQDNTENPLLSSMELLVVSSATYAGTTKSIEVRLGLPPDLADLAVFVTDTVSNVTVLDESRQPDPSLMIQHAPEMLPFDKASLTALAVAQNHVINGNFSAPDNWPTNDPTKDFYWNLASAIPNVTHVKGNLDVGGGRNIYGIFVVEGNATLDGNSRLEGVLYLPNPGSIVIHGGGDPKESTITGGVFANGSINGTGNHITVEYESDYMEIFGGFQLAQNMFIISWRESI
ncbi:MAG: hypothetical protein ONB11_10945 [candidate division KSB1 bacterium]|nr:hypothetical protein [candidate division KSB1 bacterium]